MSAQGAIGIAEDPALFAARLRPHRSLDRSGFRLLMMVVLGANLLASLPFVILGAWPVAGFAGLDILALYIAFKASYRAARAYEEVRVTAFELIVAKVTAKGQRAEWRFNPAFVRIEREEHEEFGTQRLALVSRGRSVEVAACLGPAEKADFASALGRALAQARRGPLYS